MRYIPHTPQDIETMLRAVGAPTVEALFDIIPEALRFEGELDLSPPLAEADLLQHLLQLGCLNQPQDRGSGMLVFAGAGVSTHAIPSAVDQLASRSEFYTAYTPYQPELSQGTLTAIFEFQTMVAELLGMDVANASMYDGATATAEGILMARRLKKKRDRAVLAGSIHPDYVATCETYLSGLGIDEPLRHVGIDDSGAVDMAALEAALDDSVAAVVVQTPSFLGVMQDLRPICEAAQAAGALVVAATTEPLAFALAQPPGAAGADITVGEGIGLCSPPNMGGPGLGLFAVTGKKAIRTMPGRLVGQTVDQDGKPGFVLTLSTREQHIRREKATSNICTNHGLMALRFTIHLALLGKTGLVELARLNMAKAAFARGLLAKLEGFALRFDAPTFNEFALRVPGGDAGALVERAAARGVVPGVALGRFDEELRDTLLVSVTELHRREDMERLAHELQEAAKEVTR